MNWIKRNIADLSFLIGITAINIPPYMIDVKVGLLATGISLIVLSVMLKGGE